MTDSRKDMIIHAGEQTAGIIRRPFFIAFVPSQRHGFKAFIRRVGNPFVGSLLSGIYFLSQKFTNTFALLPGIGKRNLGVWA